MSELARWGQVGCGNIGRELAQQIAADEAHALGLQPTPEFVARSTGVMAGDGVTPLAESLLAIAEMPEVVFFAPPSTDDGEPAYVLITHCLARGAKIVTAEKGSVANHPELLWNPHVDSSAACGGGTDMVDAARRYVHRADFNEMHLAVNGTLTFLASAVRPLSGEGVSTPEAVARAVELGYAEPGAGSWQEVVRAEAGDIAKKIARVANSLDMSHEFLDWKRLRFELTEEQITQAFLEGRRFITSAYPLRNRGRYEEPEPNEVLGGFDIEHNGLRIIGGFRELGRRAILSMLEGMEGPGNGFVVGLGPNNSHGVYGLTGDGAGPGPTVSAMLGGWMRQREIDPPTVQKPRIRPAPLRKLPVLGGKEPWPLLELTTDEDRAWSLWVAGLEPVAGQVRARTSSSHDMPAATQAELRATARGLAASGMDVYLGPSATFDPSEHPILWGPKVWSSTPSFLSLGLWTPRADSEAYAALKQSQGGRVLRGLVGEPYLAAGATN